MAAAAAAGEELFEDEEELLEFASMTEAELRQWVEANPRLVNDWDQDEDGITPLFTAVCLFSEKFAIGPVVAGREMRGCEQAERKWTNSPPCGLHASPYL